MRKRRETVEILLAHGADINYVTPKLRMTALHWAAYHGDPLLVQMLLDKGAEQSPNAHVITPVDMAGFMRNTETVRTFCKWVLKVIQKEN